MEPVGSDLILLGPDRVSVVPFPKVGCNDSSLGPAVTRRSFGFPSSDLAFSSAAVLINHTGNAV
jgi:hypothetical protein